MQTPKITDSRASRLVAADAHEIASFLIATDGDFSPPLSRRTDLESYAQKLITKGELVGIRQNTELVGLAAFYCNDLASKCGYMTYVGVKPHARGNGLGASLVREAIRLSTEAGMATIELQTDGDRPGLVPFYQRLGFEVVESYPRYGGFPAIRLRRSL